MGYQLKAERALGHLNELREDLKKMKTERRFPNGMTQEANLLDDHLGMHLDAVENVIASWQRYKEAFGDV